MLALQSRTDKRLDGFEKRSAKSWAGLLAELRALGERVARLQGLIEGSGLFRPTQPSGVAGD